MRKGPDPYPRPDVTRAEMQALDHAAISGYGIPGLTLMENAGAAVASFISRDFPTGATAVFVGKGNNGGDGLVVARLLACNAHPVQVVLLEDPRKLKDDPRANYSRIEQMNIPVFLADEKTPFEIFQGFCCRSQVLVDALFGIGLCRPISGGFERAIRAINQSERPVVSIDIPSGLDADSGEVHGVAVRATVTVALALPKRGFFRAQGPSHTGRIETVDIGIPPDLLKPFGD